MPEPVRLAISLIGIVIIIAGAYYTTYFIGLKGSGQSSGRNRAAGRGRVRNIVLLERFAISRDKSFCIVEIAGKIYVIGVTNQAMTVLDKLEAEDFAQNPPEDYKAPRSVIPGGQLSGKLVNKLASFIERRIGKTHGTTDSGDAQGKTFADSMKAARDKSISGQPDREEAERPDGSEGEE